MSHVTRFFQHSKQILRLAWPVGTAQVCIGLIAVVNAILCGRLSVGALGALGISAAYIGWSYGIISSINVALRPIVAQCVGAKRYKEAGHHVRQGLWVSGFGGLFFVLFYWLVTRQYIGRLGLDATLVPYVRDFLDIAIFSIIPLLHLYTLRNVADAVRYPHASMIAWGFGIVFHTVLAWALMFGHLGLPALGIQGCALTILISNMLMLGIIVSIIQLRKKKFGKLNIFGVFEWPTKQSMLELLHLGWPIGLMSIAFSVFYMSLATVSGQLGAEIAAAYSVLIAYRNLLMRGSLGFAIGGGVLVAQSLGKGRPRRARARSKNAALLAFYTSLFVGAFTLLFARQIVNVFTNDAAVAALAVTCMFWIAIFQCSDACRHVAEAVLRAYKDTRAALYASVIAHYAIGLPLLAWGLSAHPSPLVWIWQVLTLISVSNLLLLCVRYVYLSRKVLGSLRNETVVPSM